MISLFFTNSYAQSGCNLDQNMPVSYSSTVCAGDSAAITFPDAGPGMVVNARIISHWRVDDPSPKFINGLVLDSSRTIYIGPSLWNDQLSSRTSPAGINKGRNDITFTIQDGSCPPVQLNRTAVITVPDQPHTINFNSMIWWINTTSPWDPYPNLADSISISTNRPNTNICQSDSIVYTIRNAQAGVSYYARLYYRRDLQPDLIGSVVSNVVNNTVEHNTVLITVPAASLPVGSATRYSVQVVAEGFGCKPVMASYNYQVLPGPDTSNKVIIGSTVCQGINGILTIRNSQTGFIYHAHLRDRVTPVASANGNGEDLVLTIPHDSISAPRSYSFIVTVGSENCQFLALQSRPIITVNVNSQPGTITGPSAICSGDSAELTLRYRKGNIFRWQYSSDSIIWRNIITSDSTINTGALRDTIFYRAEVTGSCNGVLTPVFVVHVAKGSGDSSYVPSIAGSSSVTCLDKEEIYKVNALNKTCSWKVGKNGSISSSDTISSIYIKWVNSGADTVIVITEDMKTRCRKLARLPVTITEPAPKYSVCIPDMRLDNPAPYVVSGKELDAAVYPSPCNSIWLTNSITQTSSLDGVELSSSDTVITWHAINKSGQDAVCKTAIVFGETIRMIIPAAFTPNDDGRNDKWMIRNIESGDLVQVYDRWGNKVFETKEYNGNEWDGRNMSGRALGVDSYYYIITGNKYTKPTIGYVTIVR